MAHSALQLAYPGIAFRSRSTNWWARWNRLPPECVHWDRNVWCFAGIKEANLFYVNLPYAAAGAYLWI